MRSQRRKLFNTSDERIAEEAIPGGQGSASPGSTTELQNTLMRTTFMRQGQCQLAPGTYAPRAVAVPAHVADGGSHECALP